MNLPPLEPDLVCGVMALTSGRQWDLENPNLQRFGLTSVMFTGDPLGLVRCDCTDSSMARRRGIK